MRPLEDVFLRDLFLDTRTNRSENVEVNEAPLIMKRTLKIICNHHAAVVKAKTRLHLAYMYVYLDVLSNGAVATWQAPDRVDLCKACQPAIVNEARRRPQSRSANEIISNSR